MATLKEIKVIDNLQISLSPVGREATTAQDRFIRGFNSVWEHLPVLARAVLAARWHQFPATVYLTHGWKERDSRLAQCSANGSMFHFFSPAVSHMQDAILAECIAHELAHAFFYTTGDPHHCGGLDDRVYDKPLQERLADALARELVAVWGFSPRSLSQWCVDNRSWLEANAKDSIA
jgi:hypothetical protein